MTSKSNKILQEQGDPIMPEIELSRRDLLRGMALTTLGATLTGGFAGAGNVANAQGAPPYSPFEETFRHAEIRYSRNGLLDTSITVTKGSAMLGGQPLTPAIRTEGGVPGPTFVLRPGDKFRLKLKNQLDETTNLHFHGLHVSPDGNSDNVFLMTEPGEMQQYELHIPADHPGGLYWYHPHFHEFAHLQLDRGMAGLIVIQGVQNQIPSIRAMRQRLMTISHVQLDINNHIDPTGITGVPGSAVINTLDLINGQLMPTMKIHPGEAQYWQIANVTATVWYQLSLDGHSFWVIAEDGNPLTTPQLMNSVLLTPAKRFEIVVVGGNPGNYTFRSLGHRVDSSFSEPPVELGTLIVTGERVRTLPIPTRLPAFKDLRNEPVAQRRRIEFSELFPGGAGAFVPDSAGGGTGGGFPGGGDGTPPPGGFPGGPPGGFVFSEMDFNFWLNGVQYNPDVVNTTVKVNTVEEWTLVNISDDDHPFHLHVNPFQMTHRNLNALDPTSPNQPVEAINYNDTLRVPRGQSVTILIKFSDFTGRTVYHCHNLFHEDRGMMAIVDIEA